MSEETTPPLPYKVVYSELVRLALTNSLIPEAKAQGIGPETLAALKKLDHVLQIYPEFGEPLMHGATRAQEVRLAAFPPLCVLYGLDRDRRIVYVSRPLKLLPVRR